ncbi:unnamed protein product [Chrysoparadoxa australica]
MISTNSSSLAIVLCLLGAAAFDYGASNCYTVGGGFSPPYPYCDGCVYTEALTKCVADLRASTVCDMSSLTVDRQPECCPAYPEALNCLVEAQCTETSPIFEDLRKECEYHGCTTECLVASRAAINKIGVLAVILSALSILLLY